MARKKKPPTLAAGDPDDPEGLHVWTRRYLSWLTVRNYAEQTIRSRENYLTLFIAWAEARALTRPVEITKPILERYQRYLFHLRQQSGKPLSFRVAAQSPRAAQKLLQVAGASETSCSPTPPPSWCCRGSSGACRGTC